MLLHLEFEKRISDLRKNYVAGIARREPELAALVEKLGRGEHDPFAIKELLAELHRIRGVAPVFGFVDLAELAAAAELALANHARHESSLHLPEPPMHVLRALHAEFVEVVRTSAGIGAQTTAH
jgi:HPt (histidine-containing phosphotransfer) domain-containing protein